MNSFKLKYTILILIILKGFLLAGQSCSSDSLIQRSIRADETDGNISWELFRHQVFINPDCEQNGKLLLHFVGTFDNPASTTFYPSLAANSGFKAINLKYENSISAGTVCLNSTDIDCYTNFREEIIYGNDLSSGVEVDQDHSIMNRLKKLLVFLDENYPTENWGDFLTASDELVWSNIVLSGHSQGGGHSAYLAKQFEVERVLMFASPNDFSFNFLAPATWVSASGETPISNYYAFGNPLDNVSNYDHQFEIWTDLEMLSETDSISVDNAMCNYNNSRVLYTSNPTSPHSNMIIDDLTPVNGDTPQFTQVWEYMLGLCETSSIESESKEILNAISIYPNPTSSHLSIKSETNIAKIEVYNYAGALLKTVEPFQKEIDLNLKSNQGLLLLQLSFDNTEKKVRKKIIVN